MEKKQKSLVAFGIGTAILLVVLLIIGIVALLIEKSKTIKADPVDFSEYISDTDMEVYPYYKATANIYESANDIYLTFNKETGKFEYKTGKTLLTGGDFTVSKNEVITKYEGTSVGSNVEVKYILDGEYIFFESNGCDGDLIPDTDTFNATVSRVDANNYGYKFKFKDDGTYTLTYGDNQKPAEYTVYEGTYERDKTNPNIINRTLNDKEALPFYVYNGHFIDSFYKQISEEEYKKDMEYYESLED